MATGGETCSNKRSTTPANAASTAPIEVILRSSDGQDTFHERRLTLDPGSKIPIGRASKNTAKPELMMAPGNAFIDSPVVSREHAVLSADPSAASPSIHITDNGSMHGTTVNGNKLEPNRLTKLSNGDLLQFGADVSRNDSTFCTRPSSSNKADKYTPGFFTARKYVYESSLPNAFPNGFSVPEGETSEEEDLDVDDVNDLMMAQAPRYGSQTNPVNLDDFEDAEPVAGRHIIEIDLEEDLDEEEVTIVRVEPSAASEETEERTSSPPGDSSTPASPAEERGQVEQASKDHEELLPNQITLCESSDEGDAQSAYSSDNGGEDLLLENDMSLSDLESDSEGEPGSDLEASDESDEENDEDDNVDDDEVEYGDGDEVEKEDEDGEAIRAMRRMSTMLKHASRSANEHSPFAPRPSAPLGVPQVITASTAPSLRRDDPYPTFVASAQPPCPAALREPGAAAPAMDPFMHHLGIFEESYGHVFAEHMDSSLPPRPAAPKPGPWGASPYSAPYAPRGPNNLRMFPEDLPAYLAPHPDFSSDMFDQYPGPSNGETFHKYVPLPSHVVPESPWVPSKPTNPEKAPTPTVPVASGVQTPPQASSSEASSPPQPRRTKVSIPEIMDSPQQPPTPTSVKGESLKRKADVLEEDALEVAPEPLSFPASVPTDISATAPAARVAPAPVPAMPERPKKKLRSRLGNAAKITFGAAVAVALMSQIPDAFFEA